MNLKKENGIFKIDVLNCPVTREKALEELKSNWEDVDDLYVVNNKLNKALKCTNLSRKENIYVKDENLISKSEPYKLRSLFNFGMKNSLFSFEALSLLKVGDVKMKRSSSIISNSSFSASYA